MRQFYSCLLLFITCLCGPLLSTAQSDGEMPIAGFSATSSGYLEPAAASSSMLLPFYYDVWFYLFLLVMVILLIHLLTKGKWGTTVYDRLLPSINLSLLGVSAGSRIPPTLDHIDDQFFSLIAHELRGPFIYLQGISEKIAFLSRRGELERAKALGDQVDGLARRTGLLLDNLLYWGTAQQKELPYQPQQFQVLGICEEVVELYRAPAATKQISILMDVEVGTKAYADKTCVAMILRNLLSNALKYTPMGGEVSITARNNKMWTEISVADSGIGLDAQMKKRVLTGLLCKSKEGTAGERGTGLGLKLCHRLVKLNRGTLHLDQQRVVGSQFSFRLPVSAD